MGRSVRNVIRRLATFVVVIALVLTQGPVAAYAQDGAVIRQIAVIGAERVEAATVGSYISLHVGEPFTAEGADASIKSLFATGLFSDAKLDMQGDTLKITVVENPIINQVLFEGNHHVDTEKLQDEIDARPRAVFTRSRI